MILSPDDERLGNLKYKPGDKFMMNPIVWERKYDESFRREFKNIDRVIVEVVSYEIDHNGNIGYRLAFRQPDFSWRWFLTEKILKEDFVLLPKNPRFYMLDE
jgi:hypothetical protein